MSRSEFRPFPQIVEGGGEGKREEERGGKRQSSTFCPHGEHFFFFSGKTLKNFDGAASRISEEEEERTSGLDGAERGKKLRGRKGVTFTFHPSYLSTKKIHKDSGEDFVFPKTGREEEEETG